MIFARTQIHGNMRLTGKFEAYSLEIVSPAEAENDNVIRSSFKQELSEPTLQAEEIALEGQLKVAKGATVRARVVTAHRVEVNGTLIAPDVRGTSFIAGPTAVLNCTPSGFFDMKIHRLTTRQGGLAEMVQANTARARQLLEGSVVHPDILQDVDPKWVEQALMLIGWECAARSSSGDGGNFTLTKTEGERAWYQYLPFKTTVTDYERSMRKMLHHLTHTEGYSYPALAD